MFNRVNSHPRHYQFLLALMLIVFGIIVSAGATKGYDAKDFQHPYSYIAPVPGSELVSAGTTIAVRSLHVPGAVLFDDLSFIVYGTSSGRHVGEKVLGGDGETVIFRPVIPFEGGEKVSVTLINGQESFDYSFHVAQPLPTELLGADRIDLENEQDGITLEATSPNMVAPEPFRTAPYDLPRFTVTTGSGTTGEGYVFMSPYDYVAVGRYPAYLLILDNNGEPVFYHRFAGLPNAMDFKRQINGELTYYHRGKGESIALNDRYEEVNSYGAGNGLKSDLHDMQILDNGHRLHLVHDPQIVDMSVLVAGGHPSAVVIGCIVQELDAADNVLFEWRSWGNIDILDTLEDVTAEYINYMNCNSIERDFDGHLILSSRNTDEVTKINRDTGEIIWRMGGKQNQFSFPNDDGFSLQHDARRLPNGLMTIYDNGVSHSPPHSRGIELQVNELGKTVQLIREFRSTPDTLAYALGNMQRLPGGNTVIGWGRSSAPSYTEFDSSGGKVIEFNNLTPTVGSYRTFRFPWQGYPTWPPALIAYAEGQEVTLYFSWNGSTETSDYMIYAKPEDGGDWHVATVAKDGFENSYVLHVPADGIWEFRVIALDQNAQTTATSNNVTLLIGGKSAYLPMISTAAEPQG